MNEGSGFVRTYYVVFSKSACKRWYMRWLDKCFRHITILRKSDCGKHWIFIGTEGGNVWVDTFPMRPIREVFRCDVIVEYRSTVHKEPTLRFWHLNCVEFAKCVLGIRNMFIVTPFQLYKYILKEKNNGKRS